MSHFDEELCGCRSDIQSCLIGMIPGGEFCLQAAAINKIFKDGWAVPYLLDCFLLCIGGALNRGKIRNRFGIEGSFTKDCLI